jgi:hypothetical protein
MSGSTPPSTPTSKLHPAVSPDRPRINTPHPKALLSSPTRLTPKKLNLHFVSTDSTFSPLRTPATSNANGREFQEVEFLEITTIEKADEAFETAVYYLDEAYSNREKPNYKLISLVQDLLHQVLFFLKSEHNWRLRAFCKIEMARTSSGLYFQHHWIEKGLNDLDVHFQTSCLLIKHKKLDLVNDIINCSATYLSVSSLCLENLPGLAERALTKHHECETYLKRLSTSVEESSPIQAPSPTPVAELSIPQAASPAKDKPSTVNKTKAAFFFSMSIFILGLAIAHRSKLKHIFRKILKISITQGIRPIE